MIRWIFLAFWIGTFGTLAAADTLRMAVTTSFHNSGLSDVLLSAIEQDTGIKIQLLVVGTGQALRLGKAGDVDVVLVHSKAAEEAFVAKGYATHRRPVMYNDFVFVGPRNDPAKVQKANSAMDALQRIYSAQSGFVSRGDDSGTHNKELALWSDKNLAPQSFGTWYLEVGAGMGAALNTASALGAYTITDRASWIKFGNKGDLAMVYSGDPELFNQYAFLPINPEQHPHIKNALANRLEVWLTSDRAAGQINEYRVGGQQLFVFNAQAQP